MTVKAHPGAASVAAPVKAALDARRELADETVPVSHVTVDAPRFTTRLDDRASRYVRGPDSSLAALSGSVAYNVAVALLDGEHTPRQFAPARRGSREVWELAERVTVRADGALTEAAFDTAVPFGLMRSQLGLGVLPYTARTLGARGTLKRLPAVLRSVRKRPLPTDLAAAERRLGAHVTLHLEDGRSVTAECPHPQGFAGRPLAETRAVARGRLLDALTERAGEGTSVGPVVDDLREPEGSVSLAPVAELLERGPTATPAAMGRREHP